MYNHGYNKKIQHQKSIQKTKYSYKHMINNMDKKKVTSTVSTSTSTSTPIYSDETNHWLIVTLARMIQHWDEDEQTHTTQMMAPFRTTHTIQASPTMTSLTPSTATTTSKSEHRAWFRWSTVMTAVKVMARTHELTAVPHSTPRSTTTTVKATPTATATSIATATTTSTAMINIILDTRPGVTHIHASLIDTIAVALREPDIAYDIFIHMTNILGMETEMESHIQSIHTHTHTASESPLGRCIKSLCDINHLLQQHTPRIQIIQHILNHVHLQYINTHTLVSIAQAIQQLVHPI